jgi:hypothetical protein
MPTYEYVCFFFVSATELELVHLAWFVCDDGWLCCAGFVQSALTGQINIMLIV